MNIELANTDDAKEIRNFIKSNWAPEHIFARNAEFFEYEMSDGEEVNFVLAKNELNQISGIVGFTKNKKDLHEANLFLVVLCVLPEYAKQGLSFQLINKCIDMTSGSVNTVGAAPSVLPLYKLLGFNTGYLSHYYWVNPIMEHYLLCEPGATKFTRQYEVSDFVMVSNVLEDDFNTIKTDRRDYFSFVHRYLNHPVYDYKIYMSQAKNGLLVAREVSHEGAKALKVIDYFGDNGKLTEALIALTNEAIECGYEYIDLYCKGVEDIVVKSAGFVCVGMDKSAVIPNYFSPFTKKNIQLSYATRDESLILMRGDGDQDRPS